MSKKQDTPEELLARAYSLSNEADTRALYQDWATTYDQTMLEGLGYVTPRKTAQLLADALADKDARILDVGSGTGLAGHFLAKHGFTQIEALDFSPAMLEVAAHREVKAGRVYAKTHLLDLKEPLPIGSAQFDAMICTGTFTHAHVGPTCLEELFRVLKPGGLFACTIQKDIWEGEGFSDEVRRLADAGTLRTRGMVMNIYFETDSEPEGWYILWEKLP